MSFGLAATMTHDIRQVFAEYPQVEQVILYGSRAMGNYHDGSDIDITLSGDRINPKLGSEIVGRLEELDLLYQFDVSILHRLNNIKLIEHIHRVGVIFYEKPKFLPSGWKEEKIGEICEVIAGQSPRGSNYNNCGDGLAFYQGKREFGDKFIGAPKKWTTQITREAYADDILMSVRAPVGPINFATERICIGRGLAAIRAGNLINNEFLFYALLAKQDQIQGSEGAVFASINREQIKDITVWYPPLAEQKRIVAILNTAYAAIEVAFANIEKNLINARELFDNQLSSRVIQKPKFLPSGWKKEKIDEVCQVVNGGTPRTNVSEYWGGEHAWITPAEMGKRQSPLVQTTRRNLTDKGMRACSATIVPRHSVILSTRAPIGHLVINEIPMATNQGCRSLIPGNKLNYRFLYYFLFANVPLLNDLGTGAIFKELSSTQLKNISILLPPLAEQKRIVAILDKLAIEKESLVSIYKRKIKALTELKLSLLQRAFTGELAANKINKR